MLSEKIFKLLDMEIKLKYGNRAKAARKIGMSKEMLHAILNKLESGGAITTKTLEKLCNGLGFEVVIKKK